MIDTLILSGGGPSGICYIGIYQALLEKKFLEKNDINEIITTSIGILFSFCILIKIDLVILKEIILKYKMENYLILYVATHPFVVVIIQSFLA